MSRAVKTQGIECPIIREGDNIVDIVVDSVLKSAREIGTIEYIRNSNYRYDAKLNYNYRIEDKSVIGITESIVARAAGQYITVDDIAADIEKKFGKDATICLVNPVYSRNRFAMILKGIARAAKKVIIVMPDYDEVGNPRGVNPFTGVNIEEYYKEICKSENCECDIYIEFYIVDSMPAIDCRLHSNSACNCYIGCKLDNIYTLADICSNKSPDWGVLGTNKATEEKLKLFPSKAECQRVCEAVKEKIKEKTGKDVIVCVYGDGCFKDPVGGIWEFADPVSMTGYTDKELIESTPNEIKLKAMIDTFDEENNDIVKYICDKHKEKNLRIDNKGDMGTTPRLYRDLLASLMDLTSGSGDRATPVVLIQNYF